VCRAGIFGDAARSFLYSPLHLLLLLLNHEFSNSRLSLYTVSYVPFTIERSFFAFL